MSLRRPGANSLRGGRNTYTRKTLEGNYFEERYNPAVEDEIPSFSDPRYETTAAEQAHTATGRLPREFGAGFAEEDEKRFDKRYNYGNVIQYDASARPKEWDSLQRSTHRPPPRAKPTEFSTTFKLKGHPVTDDAAKTAEYRARWTNEAAKDFARDRYVSMNSKTFGETRVGKAYCPEALRTLAGAPLAVQKLREALLSRGGGASLEAARRMMEVFDESGDGALSRKELRWALSDCGVELHDLEFDQVFRWFDRDDSGTIDLSELFAGLQPESSAE